MRLKEYLGTKSHLDFNDCLPIKSADQLNIKFQNTIFSYGLLQLLPQIMYVQSKCIWSSIFITGLYRLPQLMSMPSTPIDSQSNDSWSQLIPLPTSSKRFCNATFCLLTVDIIAIQSRTQSIQKKNLMSFVSSGFLILVGDCCNGRLEAVFDGEYVCKVEANMKDSCNWCPIPIHHYCEFSISLIWEESQGFGHMKKWLDTYHHCSTWNNIQVVSSLSNNQTLLIHRMRLHAQALNVNMVSLLDLEPEQVWE